MAGRFVVRVSYDLAMETKDRSTVWAIVALLTALLTAAVVLAVFSDWEAGAITGFLAAVAGLGVPLVGLVRSMVQQNETLAKIDDQTNGALDRRIKAGAKAAATEAAETVLSRFQGDVAELPPAGHREGQR